MLLTCLLEGHLAYIPSLKPIYYSPHLLPQDSRPSTVLLYLTLDLFCLLPMIPKGIAILLGWPKSFLAFLLHRKPKLIFGQLHMMCLLHSQLFIHVIPASNTVPVSLPLGAVTCVIQSAACASFFYVREG